MVKPPLKEAVECPDGILANNARAKPFNAIADSDQFPPSSSPPRSHLSLFKSNHGHGFTPKPVYSDV